MQVKHDFRQRTQYKNSNIPIFTKNYVSNNLMYILESKAVNDTVSFGAKSTQEKIKSGKNTTISIRKFSSPISPDSIVLYIPGLNINKSNCEKPFLDPFITKNCAVYGLDRPYVHHKKPSGTNLELSSCKNLFKQVSEAVNYLSEKHKQPIHLVGFSLGGGLAAQVAANPELSKNVASILLFSPTLLDNEGIENVTKKMPRDKHGKLPDFWKKLIRVSDGLVEKADNIKVPTTIVSGDQELSCSMQYLKSFMKKIQVYAKHLIILKGMGHNLSHDVFDSIGIYHLKLCSKKSRW